MNPDEKQPRFDEFSASLERELMANFSLRLTGIHSRLDKGNGPWADYEASRQPIGAAMKTLGFKAGRKSLEDE